MECVEYLINKLGVSPDQKSVSGYSPIHYATLGGAKEVMLYLLTEFNVNCNSCPRGDGYTPMCLATVHESDEVLNILFECGAKYIPGTVSPVTSAIQNRNAKPLLLLLEKNIYVNQNDMRNYSPLMKCIANNVDEGIDLIISNGAQINYTTSDGKSALYVAIFKNKPDIVKKLIENGANVNQKGFNHQYPIHWACHNGSLEIIELLLENDANPNVLCKKHKLPINFVPGTNPDTIKILKLLIGLGNNINNLAEDGALIGQYIPNRKVPIEVFEFLVQNGLDLSIRPKPTSDTYWGMIQRIGRKDLIDYLNKNYTGKK